MVAERATDAVQKVLSELKEKYCKDTPETRAESAIIARRKWKERCEARGVPRHIWDLVSGGVDEAGFPFNPYTEALQTVVRHINKGKRFIILSGPSGSGKTVALSWLLTSPDFAFTFGGEHGTFVHISDICDEYGKPKEIYRTGWMPLVIDDLGEEADQRKGAVAEVLRHRHSDLCITFISTNLIGEQILRRYDERTASRLLETGTVIRVTSIVRPGTARGTIGNVTCSI